jgi:hypothetical protein
MEQHASVHNVSLIVAEQSEFHWLQGRTGAKGFPVTALPSSSLPHHMQCSMQPHRLHDNPEARLLE